MKNRKIVLLLWIAIFISLLAVAAFGQTTLFTYQGKLTEAGSPASGSYQMQFKLFDALAGGEQIGSTITDMPVTVTQGIFMVKLDFGANALNGANRWLEIAVRRNAGESYVTLSPREQIASSPYSIQALKAVDSQKLGGVDASEYITDTTNSFIRNQDAQQPMSRFNVSGDGFIGGNVGIGTMTPSAKLDVSGDVRAVSSSLNSIIVETTGTNTGAILAVSAPGRSWLLGTSSPGNAFWLLDGLFDTRISVQPNRGPISFPLGNVGIGTSAPAHRLALGASGPAWTGHAWTGSVELPNVGAIGWRPNTSNQSFGIGQTNWGLSIFRSGVPLGTWGANPIYAMNIDNSGNVGIGTLEPTTKLDVVGTVKTRVLQITGGSDLAENFEFAEEVKPGKVVAIDPRNQGKLILARGAYNRRVAGIVSGANNLSAGMILPDLTDTKNALPVALSGRAWVYADARENPIQPGDLLTTSETPGYAMKVKNHKKAQGAIIGKAMSELNHGTGLVLVLVNLQ